MALYVGAFPHPKQPRGCLVIMATLCLAADLLCAEKRREKGGLEEEKDGLAEEKDANKLLRTGFRNRAVTAWLGGSPGGVIARRCLRSGVVLGVPVPPSILPPGPLAPFAKQSRRASPWVTSWSSIFLARLFAEGDQLLNLDCLNASM